MEENIKPKYLKILELKVNFGTNSISESDVMEIRELIQLHFGTMVKNVGWDINEVLETDGETDGPRRVMATFQFPKAPREQSKAKKK